MTKKIGVFVYMDDPVSNDVLKMVQKYLTDNQYVVRWIPPAMRMEEQGYEMPFISDEDHAGHHGLDGIQYFLEHRHELRYRPVLNPQV